jgi:hypothetical protein
VATLGQARHISCLLTANLENHKLRYNTRGDRTGEGYSQSIGLWKRELGQSAFRQWAQVVGDVTSQGG